MSATATIPHRILTELGNRVAAMSSIAGSPWDSVTLAEHRQGEREVYEHGVAEVAVAAAPTPVSATQLQVGFTQWTMDVAVSVVVNPPTAPVDPDHPTEVETQSLQWVALHGINTILQAVTPSQHFLETGVANAQLAEMVELVGSAIERTPDESETAVQAVFRFTFQTRTDNLALTS